MQLQQAPAWVVQAILLHPQTPLLAAALSCHPVFESAPFELGACK
jgi:hypothetical protein